MSLINDDYIDLYAPMTLSQLCEMMRLVSRLVRHFTAAVISHHDYTRGTSYRCYLINHTRNNRVLSAT